MKIDVKDEDLSDQGRPLDGYPDISYQTNDSCLKTTWVLANNHNRTYTDITDDIQQSITDYVSGVINNQQTQLTNTFQQISNTTSVSSAPGLSSILENRSLKDLFTNGGVNLNLNTNFINGVTANASQKIDQ